MELHKKAILEANNHIGHFNQFSSGWYKRTTAATGVIDNRSATRYGDISSAILKKSLIGKKFFNINNDQRNRAALQVSTLPTDKDELHDDVII